MFDQYYQEKLPCGGDLRVSKTSWDIRYYYPGRDRRHSGEFFTIYSQEIEEFIEALRNNFATYLKLKESIPNTGRFTTTGEKGMTIAIDDYLCGVSIYQYRDFIADQEEINSRIASYEFAITRAATIQTALQQI